MRTEEGARWGPVELERIGAVSWPTFMAVSGTEGGGGWFLTLGLGGK